jgi:hypothetical protein
MTAARDNTARKLIKPPSITDLLNRAEACISAGEDRFREAAEAITAANELGATQRQIAKTVGKSAAWVNGLLKWRLAGYPDTPFGPQAKASRARAARVQSTKRHDLPEITPVKVELDEIPVTKVEIPEIPVTKVEIPEIPVTKVEIPQIPVTKAEIPEIPEIPTGAQERACEICRLIYKQTQTLLNHSYRSVHSCSTKQQIQKTLEALQALRALQENLQAIYADLPDDMDGGQ